MTTTNLPPAWRRYALCLLFAILMSLSFPPLQLGFLAYWGLLPLFYLLEGLSYKQALKWAYLAGVLWNLGTLYWIGWVTLPGLVGVILVLPLYLLIYVWAHLFLRQRLGAKYIFLTPFVWTAVEYLKSLGSLGFPWTSLAYTQTYYTDLIQYASLTGAYGVSFWIVWINVILFVIIKQRPIGKRLFSYLIALVLLFLLPLIYAKLVVPRPSEFKEGIRVALVQGNIDPYLKWDDSFVTRNMVIYDSLTLACQNQKPELVIWPETATACFLRAKLDYQAPVLKLVDQLNAPILTGSPDYRFLENGKYETYNGLLLLQPDFSPMQSYWKMHLVPFGERVPFEDSIPYLHNFFENLNMGTGDFAPGHEYKIFTMNWHNQNLPFAGVICYESVFPDQVRRFIKMGGKLLVIVTNDAWFGNTSGPYQHNQIAIFRAIENRVSIARCANTGISCLVDPFGKILARTKLNEQTTLTGNVPLYASTTFYTQHGDLFAIVLTGLSGMALVLATLRRS